tara:strand:- start:584 stop:1117 length:534 start_codon:yes stop_codon:yes gene_type:complete
MSCPICTEELNENDLYILPECDHMFHVDCIVSWFRMGNNRCPYCNNPGDCNIGKDEENNGFHKSFYFGAIEMKQRVKLIRQAMKTDNELSNNSELKNLIKRHDEIEDKIQKTTLMKKEIMNQTGNFTEIKREVEKLRRRYWDLNSQLRKIAHKIAAFPIKEVIIVKKKYIKKELETN